MHASDETNKQNVSIVVKAQACNCLNFVTGTSPFQENQNNVEIFLLATDMQKIFKKLCYFFCDKQVVSKGWTLVILTLRKKVHNPWKMTHSVIALLNRLYCNTCKASIGNWGFPFIHWRLPSSFLTLHVFPQMRIYYSKPDLMHE